QKTWTRTIRYKKPISVIYLQAHRRNPMHSVAASIWNQIAEKEQLRTQWAAKMFKLDQEQLTDALEREAEQLIARGIPETIVAAYQSVKALFLENVAISQWITDTGRDGLRTALPEICSVN